MSAARLTEIFKTICVVLLIGVYGNAFAEEGTEEKSYTMCRNGSMVRTIRIFKPAGSAQCKVTYTKDGVDQAAGAAKGFEVCNNVRKKIRNNLEKLKWKCKEVSLIAVDEASAENAKDAKKK